MPKTPFKQMLQDLDIFDKNTKRVNPPRDKLFNHIKDNVPLIPNANMMCDLLFLPVAKFGFKYLFCIVDLATDKFDIEPIKNKEPSTVLSAMQKCFKRGIIKEPEYTLKTDSGNEFNGVFAKWLYDENILKKTSLPKRHQTMGNIENLNRQVSRMLNLYMNSKEKQSGKKFVNWPEFVPTIRTELNKIREKKLPQDINSYEYAIPNNVKEIPQSDSKKSKVPKYELIKPKFKVGQYVFRYLDQTRNALNKNQPTEQRREGDINWDNIPREILQVFTMGGEGPLYRYLLEGLPNVSFTESQLRRALAPP